MLELEQLSASVVWRTQSIAEHCNSVVNEAVLKATERSIQMSPIRF